MSDVAGSPEAAGDGGSEPRPPGDVVTAVRLMYLGAALTALLGLLRILDRDEFRDVVEESSGDELARLSSDSELAGYVMFAFVVAAVWLLIAWGCRRGRRRYRAAGTVFGAMYLLATSLALSRVGFNASTVVSVAMAVVAAAVLWLLYRPDARRYFAAGRQVP